jgi:hypothetical protein
LLLRRGFKENVGGEEDSGRFDIGIRGEAFELPRDEIIGERAS